MMKTCRRVLMVLALLAHTFPAQASNFPGRPVTLVVPFAAGGPLDVVARIIADAMARDLKQPVLIENTAGAGGTLGAARVARAAPDGYTLLMYHVGMATSPALYKNRLSFHPVNDFEPVGIVNEVAMVLVTRRDLAARDLTELATLISRNSETIKLANAGVGSASHLCTLLMSKTFGKPLNAIPYRGTGPAMNDLLGGHIDIMCDLVTNASGQIAAGAIKAYGVTGSARLAALPQVPTMAEAGQPQIDMTNWNAVFAPKGTPQAAIERLSSALRNSLVDDGVKSKLAAIGTAPIAADRATPEALAALLIAEIARWTLLIEAAGVEAR